MLTDAGDLVMDPFAGSCVTGEVAERLGREWVCVDTVEPYLRGAKGRFGETPEEVPKSKSSRKDAGAYYRIPHPGLLWNRRSDKEEPLPKDGGRHRSAP